MKFTRQQLFILLTALILIIAGTLHNTKKSPHGTNTNTNTNTNNTLASEITTSHSNPLQRAQEEIILESPLLTVNNPEQIKDVDKESDTQWQFYLRKCDKCPISSHKQCNNHQSHSLFNHPVDLFKTEVVNRPHLQPDIINTYQRINWWEPSSNHSMPEN